MERARIFTGGEDEAVVFQIQARRCQRCGGLLTSRAGLRDGYGPCCLRKMQEEAARKRAMKNQISLFQDENEEESGHGDNSDG